MCRMFIFIGKSNDTRILHDRLLGSLIMSAKFDPHGKALYGLSRHSDGWGMLWIEMDGDRLLSLSIHRSIMPIYNDYVENIKNIIYKQGISCCGACPC